MSFIITLYVSEGIVMAADSRLTIHANQQEDDKPVVRIAVGQSDSLNKLFLAPGQIGISTSGAMAVDRIPLAAHVETFMRENMAEYSQIEDVPYRLLEYFRAFDPIPNTTFNIGGYANIEGRAEQQIWMVNVAKEEVKQVNPPGQQGATWSGEGDILTRLIQPARISTKEGEPQPNIRHHPIPWAFFTLQDAIDFATFAVQTTAGAIRFQSRPKTVGGPVDVLVIKPEGASWVQRKGLHG